MTLIKMKNRKLRHIDAREILTKYADYEFGIQEINEIFLALIRSKATPDGFYEIVSSVKF